MKLYMHPLSNNARRPRIVARLLGITLEEIVVDMQSGANRKPEYLAINPNGKVPTLIDEDFKLFESSAICQYLAARARNTTLWPTDPRKQAEVSQWQLWGHIHLGSALGTLIFENMFKRYAKIGEPDAARVADATKETHRFSEVLEGALKGKSFVCGSDVTLGDVTISPGLFLAERAGFSLEKYPNIRAWLGRLGEMDAWKATAPQFGG